MINALCKISFFFALLASFFPGGSAQAQLDSMSEASMAYVLEVRDVIDPRMNRYIHLGLAKAHEEKASLVILDMDTYGGAVVDADEIRTNLMEFDIPVYVFINNTAGSAGALISIACDSIYMTKGANIGAATAVDQNGTVLPEKIQSFMRSMMRTTAEAQGRDPKIAEAMVGHNLNSDSATVLSLTTSEAIDTGYCEGQVASIEDILEKTEQSDLEVKRFKLGSSESIIAFFLNPIVKSVLVLLILGGIYFELQTPGVGFPLIAAITGAVLYFVPDYLHGFLAYWELLLFLAGLVLLAIEVFVTPGFGIIGGLGIASCIGGLVLSMVKNDNFNFDYVASSQLLWAMIVFAVACVGGVFVFLAGGAALTKSKAFQRLTLQESIDSNAHGTVSSETKVGLEGVAATVLRPSGRVLIAGDYYDAHARNGFVEKGAKIKVIADEGVSLKVITIE